MNDNEERLLCFRELCAKILSAFYIGDHGTFMIDDKFADMSAEVKQAISDASGATPKFLVNTHWHGDHTGGNEALATEGAVIVAHENVRQTMSVDNVISAFDAQVPAATGAALPMVTFDSTVRFILDGDRRCSAPKSGRASYTTV